MARRELTAEDRLMIQAGIGKRMSIRAIAALLGRAPSVISREIRRNVRWSRAELPLAADVARARYRASEAHGYAAENRQRVGWRKVDAYPLLHTRVLRDLKRGLSPEQIAGRLEHEAESGPESVLDGSTWTEGLTVSHEAIYTWIYAMPVGELKHHGIMLRKGGAERLGRSKRSKAGNSAYEASLPSIETRPAEAQGRKVPGHWEGDLVMGARNATAVGTLVERKSRFLILVPLPAKSTTAVTGGVIDKVHGLPQALRKTLTWDRGKEMAGHAAITLATDMDVYFADPHSPWQRGTNENTNGLLRQYLPKGSKIPSDPSYLEAIAFEMNNRPRKTLGFKTPREVFLEDIEQAVANMP
ncbi:IS30 family transposase [Sinomonas susongensis]|uniref:IS30 family transposase n=2 Tax=Sinomonas susongensis TaxID=1324851 RepID=UPI001109B036|nr:IS30 family transposase [Sinomonas susongensis]